MPSKGSQTLQTLRCRAVMHVAYPSSSTCRADIGPLPRSLDTRNIHRHTSVIAEPSAQSAASTPLSVTNPPPLVKLPSKGAEGPSPMRLRQPTEMKRPLTTDCWWLPI